MAETTATTLEELVATEAIDTLILDYQWDSQVALPFARFKSMAGVPSNVASFPRYVKDSTTDIADETTSLTAETLETTQASITMARVGIARELTEVVKEDTVIGRARLMADVINDAAVLLAEAAEEDFLAEFANASNDVTDSGNDLEIVDLVVAMGKQRAAKAKGPQVYILGDQQLSDLQDAQVAATATPWQTFYQPNNDNTAFGGFFMGAPVFASGLNATANTGANVIGCLFTQGQAAPRYAAFGYAVKRTGRSDTDKDILKESTLFASISRYGVGTIAANFATKIVTDA